MAIVCDLCGKSPTARDGGVDGMHCITSAFRGGAGGVCVTFELAREGLRFGGAPPMICLKCFDKLHVMDVLYAGEKRAEEYDRRRAMAAERNVVDVTPRQIDGARRTRLLGAGEGGA